MDMLRLVVAVALVLVGCRDQGVLPNDPPVTGARPSGPKGAESARVSGAMSHDVPIEVLMKICAIRCGGPMSTIAVYRDGNGKVSRLLRLYGACSHNAALYFDATGTPTETIPETPVVVGSDEAKAFESRGNRQVVGLQRAETVSCGALP
jgi:hypothetical protein